MWGQETIPPLLVTVSYKRKTITLNCCTVEKSQISLRQDLSKYASHFTLLDIFQFIQLLFSSLLSHRVNI